MFTDLLDLICPRLCVGCGARGSALCRRCAPGLQGPAYEVRPTPCPPGLPPVRAVATYDDVVRAALVSHKERARLDLSAPLGAALARAA